MPSYCKGGEVGGLSLGEAVTAGLWGRLAATAAGRGLPRQRWAPPKPMLLLPEHLCEESTHHSPFAPLHHERAQLPYNWFNGRWSSQLDIRLGLTCHPTSQGGRELDLVCTYNILKSKTKRKQ